VEFGKALSEQTEDIRSASRALAREFAEAANELKRSRPNEDTALAKYGELLDIFEKMAGGLSALADALDKATLNASDGKPEPVFLGIAGQVVQQLRLGLMEWLEANRTVVIDVPVRIGLFGLGVAFLHSIGADSGWAVTAVGTLALKGKSVAPKPKARGNARRGRGRDDRGVR
jgi:hypothetical protein